MLEPPTLGSQIDLVLGNLGFMFIPEGSVVVGSPGDEYGREDWEEQAFAVIYDSFYLLATEVTEAQFQTHGGSVPSLSSDPDRPVTGISWDEVHGFCARLTETYSEYQFRLPTEQEWEYACRAGTRAPFAVSTDEKDELALALDKSIAGDQEYLERFVEGYAWFAQSSPDRVAQRRPNAWGLHDMHGNVWEWCADTDLPDPDLRPIRGGAWSSTTVWGCRSAVRGEEYYDARKPSIGFRIVAEPR
ncbi:MAG: formylglycine-generating enzyme family protein [Planctomycetaceae bacterium]|nr:formylglycine-generating enzyme family protein [Planctomycetaceae bacterium]